MTDDLYSTTVSLISTSPAVWLPATVHVSDCAYVPLEQPPLIDGLAWGQSVTSQPRDVDPILHLDLAMARRTAREVTYWLERERRARTPPELTKEDWLDRIEAGRRERRRQREAA